MASAVPSHNVFLFDIMATLMLTDNTVGIWLPSLCWVQQPSPIPNTDFSDQILQ